MRLLLMMESEVEAVAEILSRPAQSKGLEFVVLIKQDVPDIIVGDPLRLRQVLLNLATNAIKFTAKGEVVMAVTQEGCGDDQWLRCSVRDT